MSFTGKAAVRLAAVVAVVLAALSFVAAAPAAPVTASNDALRTGWYPDEPQLSPAALASGSFGQIFETPIQGQVYAQPLVSNGTLLVVTEDNWIYGLDPVSGAVRWSRNVGAPFEIEAEFPGCTDLVPNVGITGTPVIDPDSGTAYFLAKTYSALPKAPIWQMHAGSMATGQEAPGFPVTICGNADI
ncbi:MAG: PQQ-binding-like beta-propeller repeat protein, partial [Solirubrobacterales bacterium]